MEWNLHAGHLNLMPAAACLVNLSDSCRPSVNEGMALALGNGHWHRFLSTSAADIWIGCLLSLDPLQLNLQESFHFRLSALLFGSRKSSLCLHQQHIGRSYVRYLFSFCVGPDKANLTNHREQCLIHSRAPSAFPIYFDFEFEHWFMLFFYWRKVQMIVCSNKSLREHLIIQ